MIVVAGLVVGTMIAFWNLNAPERGPVLAQIQGTSVDGDRDGKADRVKLTLQESPNAPFDALSVDVYVNDREVSLVYVDERFQTRFSMPDRWGIGESLYLDCVPGVNYVDVRIYGSSVAQFRITCDE